VRPTTSPTSPTLAARAQSTWTDGAAHQPPPRPAPPRWPPSAEAEEPGGAAGGSWLDPATRAELGGGYARLYQAALGQTLGSIEALAPRQAPAALKEALLGGLGRWAGGPAAIQPLAC
jgi:hypothetical protein